MRHEQNFHGWKLNIDSNGVKKFQERAGLKCRRPSPSRSLSAFVGVHASAEPLQSGFNAKAQRCRGAKVETEFEFRKTKAPFRNPLRRQSDPVILCVFAVLSPDIVAFGKDFSGKVVAQASRLCVPAKLSPVTETHGRDARATLLATFLWSRLCHPMSLR
jgi:hypothetical protein